ncbi:unnamed protein product [Cyprideis torosa]|uniref:Uncharacterized protein n=1 Tax=Cyprideis torosa TaxID=163714 RepID=A0A7R8WBS3_9CRUS|nr:unnamed protein product [Cyprideis torosa]CAG0886636.1 unnamed protein product [Cyprideis torosa]
MSAAGPNFWASLSPLPNTDVPVPSARCKHASVYHQGGIYILGGRNGTLALKDFWRLDVETGEWRELKSQGRPPPHLEEHSMVAWRGNIYVFGGEVGFSSSDEVPLWIYDMKCNKWRKHFPAKGDPAPLGRRGHVALVYQKSMFIHGGYQDLKGSTGEIWAFNLDTEHWEEILPPKSTSSAELPSPRHSHSAVLHDTAMWIYGGMTNLTEKDDLWRYDLVCGRWSSFRLKGSPGYLNGHCAIKVRSSMLLFGGQRDGVAVNEIWRYHFGTEGWERLMLPGLNPNPRTHFSLVCPLPSSAAEQRHHIDYDRNVMEAQAVFDSYNRDICANSESFMRSQCIHRQKLQQLRAADQSLSQNGNPHLPEGKNNISPESEGTGTDEEVWYEVWKEQHKKKGMMARTESFSSGSNNIKFFREFSRMSLNRLSQYYSYSALSDDGSCDDVSSIRSSVSGSNFDRSGNNRKNLPHEPYSMPSFQGSLCSPTESFNSHQHLPVLLRGSVMEGKHSRGSSDFCSPGSQNMIELSVFSSSQNNKDGNGLDDPTSDYASVDTDSSCYENPNYETITSGASGRSSEVDRRKKAEQWRQYTTSLSQQFQGRPALSDRREYRPKWTHSNKMPPIEASPVHRCRSRLPPTALCEADFMPHENLRIEMQSRGMQDTDSITSSEVERETVKIRCSVEKCLDDEDNDEEEEVEEEETPVRKVNKYVPLVENGDSPLVSSRRSADELFLYVLGGKEVGQIVAFRRPLSVWRLDLRKWVITKGIPKNLTVEEAITIIKESARETAWGDAMERYEGSSSWTAPHDTLKVEPVSSSATDLPSIDTSSILPSTKTLGELQIPDWTSVSLFCLRKYEEFCASNTSSSGRSVHCYSSKSEAYLHACLDQGLIHLNAINIIRDEPFDGDNSLHIKPQAIVIKQREASGIAQALLQDQEASQVRFGFGTFVDKPLMPFVYDEKRDFNYKHMLNFTRNVEDFQTKVMSIQTLDSRGDSEGGLEALLQVALCRKQINGNPNNRMVVVFITDSKRIPKFAGDGKVATVFASDDEATVIYTELKRGLKSQVVVSSFLNKAEAVKDEIIKAYLKLQGEIKLDFNTSALNPEPKLTVWTDCGSESGVPNRYNFFVGFPERYAGVNLWLPLVRKRGRGPSTI